MEIRGIPSANSLLKTNKAKTSETAMVFKELLESQKNREEDCIQISRQGQGTHKAAEAAQQTKPVRTTTVPSDPGPDQYNKGVPCGVRAQKVLNTLTQLRAEASNYDYTGMSDKEIYRAIYQRYDDAFGGNLGGASNGALGVYLDVGAGQWQGVDIVSQMYDEISTHVGPEMGNILENPYGRILKLEGEVLYGGMTMEERKNYIENKYPGKQTTLEYCSYIWDMSVAGLVPEHEASQLMRSAQNHASTIAVNKFYGKEGDTRLQILDSQSELMETERMDITERFDILISQRTRETDKVEWKNYLDDFLQSIGKQWTKGDKQ